MSNFTNKLVSALLEIQEKVKAGADISIINHDGKISVLSVHGNEEILMKSEEHLGDALIGLAEQISKSQ